MVPLTGRPFAGRELKRLELQKRLVALSRGRELK